MTSERPRCGKCGHVSGYSWSSCGGACPMPGSPVYSAETARIVALEQALALLIRSQQRWEDAVAVIIGRPPTVFERDIDVAKKVLLDAPVIDANKALA